METTNENRIETYRKASEEIRDLYTSDSLVEIIDKIKVSFNISQPFKTLSDIIGDTVLGLYKISDMSRLFQQKLGVSADESQRMVSQLIELLAPVVKREEEEASAKKQSLQALAQKFESPVPIDTTKAEASSLPTPSSIPPAPERIPELTENVEPIRTMEGDMSRVHGYGAYRDMHKDEEAQDNAASVENS